MSFQVIIDLFMVYLLVRYSAQHDALSDRARVEGAACTEVSDYHWHMSVWKFRWPLLVYFAVESYCDLFRLLQSQLALIAPVFVFIMASAHDVYYFSYRRDLAKYADGRKRPEWINRIAKFLRDVWGIGYNS